MKLTEEQLKQIFEQQTSRSAARRVECLTEDQFARTANDEMNQLERSVVARHLVTCADCMEEYRIVRSLKPWADEADQMRAAALPVASRREAAAIPVRNTVVHPSFWNGLTAFVTPSRATLALAAMLFLVMFGAVLLLWNRQEQSRELARLNQQLADRDRALGSAQESLSETQRRLAELEKSRSGQSNQPDHASAGENGGSPKPETDASRLKEQVASLQQSARELSQPQLEVPIIDLDPSAVRGGSSGPTTTIDIPPTANSFTLILNFSGESYPAYGVEILDAGGRGVWSGQVRAKGRRSINLTLSRSLVASGRYLIKLSGLKDGRKERVAEYPLQVRY